MDLGVVVTEDRWADDALSVLEAAERRGWGLRCFLTDSGVNLLTDRRFLAFLGNSEAHVSACELSIDRYGVHPDDMNGERVIIGGQYQDAELVRNSDRVLVL